MMELCRRKEGQGGTFANLLMIVSALGTSVLSFIFFNVGTLFCIWSPFALCFLEWEVPNEGLALQFWSKGGTYLLLIALT